MAAPLFMSFLLDNTQGDGVLLVAYGCPCQVRTGVRKTDERKGPHNGSVGFQDNEVIPNCRLEQQKHVQSAVEIDGPSHDNLVVLSACLLPLQDNLDFGLTATGEISVDR